MTTDAPAYGLWSLVVINAAIFIFFAFGFTKPRTARDWRSFGAFSAFLAWTCSRITPGIYGRPYWAGKATHTSARCTC